MNIVFTSVVNYAVFIIYFITSTFSNPLYDVCFSSVMNFSIVSYLISYNMYISLICYKIFTSVVSSLLILSIP